MHIICKRLDAGRKSFRVGDDRALCIAAHLPAVVNIHILVAGRFHPAADHGVRHLSNEFVAHVAAELVPAVPSHGWSWRQGTGGLSISGRSLTLDSRPNN